MNTCTVTLSGKKYTLKFKTRAMSAIEDAFGSGTLQLIMKDGHTTIAFAATALYAGRLYLKKKLPEGWDLEAAEELIDEHEEKGGSWMDVTKEVSPVIIRKIPQFAQLLDERDAAKEEEAETPREVDNPLSTEQQGK